jgi:hypothetical protein
MCTKNLVWLDFMANRSIFYYLEFQNNEKLLYPIHVDPKTNISEDMYSDQELLGVDWIQLRNHPCSHCPLINDPSQVICPVAKSIYTLVDKFKKTTSFEKITVYVKTKEREYVKNTDMQSALCSLFGLLMATSRCPYTDFLKPISTMHLPFSTINETVFRVISSVLIKEFVEGNKLLDVDQLLSDLKNKYKNLTIINENMLKRLESVSQSDAGKNAIIALNLFGQMFTLMSEAKFSVLLDIFSDVSK